MSKYFFSHVLYERLQIMHINAIVTLGKDEDS